MTTTHLNLARKWRSKDFDQIIGQELSVRMLKNSLYLGQFFPVYLFSGQRGCGKTSTARVFAAALNCERLVDFQANPKKHIVPCLTCSSCSAIQAGKHPDFIEIDAASHTGVDNVRQIIEACSLLPLMGRKKIYLIDEAHMLSKAAFNAFLKILEEPPSSVLFILATTNPQKIIETVKSRCFQLFFKPVAAPSLLQHLTNVCESESLPFEKEGLDLVVKETEGSVRDALNLMEQVRFSSSRISKDAVLQVLGHLDDERLLGLFKVLLSKSSADLLRFLKANQIASFSASYIWSKLIELTRASIWIKHGVEPDYFASHANVLKRIVRTCSWEQLNYMLDLFYTNEQLFLKTTAQHAVLEMILLQLVQRNENDNSSGAPSSAQGPVGQEECETDEDDEYDEEDDEEEEDEEEEEVEENELVTSWKNFLVDVQTLEEPLLSSVFGQGVCVRLDQSESRLDVEFSKELIFFKDLLEETGALWQPLLKKAFGQELVFNSLFTGKRVKKEVIKSKSTPVVQQPEAQKAAPKASAKPSAYMQKNNYAARARNGAASSNYAVQSSAVKEVALDISDELMWEKTTMLLRHFPGSVSEIKENLHEHAA